MVIEEEMFNQNLLLTKAYCQTVLQDSAEIPAKSLRTLNNLNGKPLFKFVDYSHWHGIEWIEAKDPTGDRKVYGELFKSQLHSKAKRLGEVIEADYKGRILVAEVDETVQDGASEAVSDGFIDINDCPPIDTWFYITKKDDFWVLFAWIPECFIELTQVAIDVNCMDCLYWYNNEGAGSYSKNAALSLDLKSTRIGFWHRLKNLFN